MFPELRDAESRSGPDVRGDDQDQDAVVPVQRLHEPGAHRPRCIQRAESPVDHLHVCLREVHLAEGDPRRAVQGEYDDLDLDRHIPRLHRIAQGRLKCLQLRGQHDVRFGILRLHGIGNGRRKPSRQRGQAHRNYKHVPRLLVAQGHPGRHLRRMHRTQECYERLFGLYVAERGIALYDRQRNKIPPLRPYHGEQSGFRPHGAHQHRRMLQGLHAAERLRPDTRCLETVTRKIFRT